MKDFNSLINYLKNKKYLNAKDIQYMPEYDFLYSPYEYKEFLKFKSELALKEEDYFVLLDLKSFNNAPLYFFKSNELVTMFLNYNKMIIDDFEENKVLLSIRNMDSITRSKIYSELEGSLNVENVPTTRKAVDEIVLEKREPSNLNERIIKNMSKGIDFINTLPVFNKENLFKLYSILSFDCLDDDDKLSDGMIYRNDSVEIDIYKGCPASQIEECMDSLFNFVNKNLHNINFINTLPHIAHYYVVYIHPYFDYNGRTARMVSYWISLLMNNNVLPPTVSEAINQTKKYYYLALSETRDSLNDLSYFLLYIYKVSISYFICYKNIEVISTKLQNRGICLSETEKNYIKRILISQKGKFSYKDFSRWCNIDFSKQGAFKILNKFVSYGILVESSTSSNSKLFELNSKNIKYKINFSF